MQRTGQWCGQNSKSLVLTQVREPYAEWKVGSPAAYKLMIGVASDFIPPVSDFLADNALLRHRSSRLGSTATTVCSPSPWPV